MASSSRSISSPVKSSSVDERGLSIVPPTSGSDSGSDSGSHGAAGAAVGPAEEAAANRTRITVLAMVIVTELIVQVLSGACVGAW